MTAFREELVLVTARRWASLAALRAGTPESGPTALVFRTGCTYRQRLEQMLTEFGWPSAARFELGTLDGMIGCVAADMGVTLLPRAVVERNEERQHPHPPARPVAVTGRHALHPAPQRASIQRAAGFCSLASRKNSKSLPPDLLSRGGSFRAAKLRCHKFATN